MSRPFDICVRGAGIVGRAMALQLASKRLRVALVDAQPEATPGHSDVRAYALSPASRSLLESLRCWPDAAHATPVKAMEVTGDNGGLLHFEAAGQGVAGGKRDCQSEPAGRRLPEQMYRRCRGDVLCARGRAG